MFEKLLASLPYNPSLLHQLSFYGKRMRREESFRRTGTVFLVLAFLIQFFAVISPPQPTVADSQNDLIANGFKDPGVAVDHCRRNLFNYQDILATYGISCDAVASAVASAQTVKLASTAESNQLYSMGRISHSEIKGNQPITIKDGSTYYVRFLWGWSTTKVYDALKVTASTGTTYWILYDCGNLVSKGVPVPLPPPPPPAPTPNFSVQKGVRLHKDGASWDGPYYKDITVNPGDTVDFSIELQNTGNADIDLLHFKDDLPPGLTAIGGSLRADGTVVSGIIANYRTKLSLAKQFTRVTFTAMVSPSVDACGAKALVNKVTADFGDNKSPKDSSATVQACQPQQTPTPTPTPTPIPTPTPTPPPTIIPCAYIPSLPATSPLCKPCDQAVSSNNALACLSFRKTAANVTQGLPDANKTQAHAGDTIVYTLYAKNNGKADVKDFVFQENISDVLDYADIIDYHGGAKDINNVLAWPAVTVKAGETVMQRVTVKVKNPIPQTPASSSDPGHFDLLMTNVFGESAITISLPGGTIKKVETVAAKLPNTGPGTSLMVAAFTVMLAGYFYARSRLLASEVTIAIQDNNSGGF